MIITRFSTRNINFFPSHGDSIIVVLSANYNRIRIAWGTCPHWRTAWKVRLSHIKTETLVRYAKDRKRTVA